MTPRELLRSTSEDFSRCGVPDPLNDASWILSHICGRSPLSLRLDDRTELDSSVLIAFRAMAARRARREPLQYILGETPFCGLSFLTDPRVLIPRPETELLCEWASELLSGTGCASVLDLCCGSGCIGIALKHMVPSASVTLSDLSKEALALAAENASRLCADVRLVCGDLFDPLPGELFSMIVTNPPYIRTDECASLQKEIRFEPLSALCGGQDGLDFYRRICREAPGHLHPRGTLLMELGDGEAHAVHQMMESAGFTGIEIRRDLNHLERMISGICPEGRQYVR